jgi:hypothetical protein
MILVLKHLLLLIVGHCLCRLLSIERLQEISSRRSRDRKRRWKR